MRITAGKHRNRQLVVPATRLRPTTDMARQALFNILGMVDGLSFADLCAGSGSVGLDALSRGAGSVVFVEQDRVAVQAIKTNLQNLGLEARVVHKSVLSFVTSWEGPAFDIVYLDPPYDSVGLYVNLTTSGLARLVRGQLVLEIRAGGVPPAFPGLSVTENRRYGDASLVFYSGEQTTDG